MIRPDIGVFIDAHHLVPVKAQFRQSSALMKRIETSAMQLSLGEGISHRVVLADCAQKAPRAIAESLGLYQGFRIRHCPGNDGVVEVSTVLAAEIYDAVASSGLRTVVVVASPRPLGPLIDTLHRTGRLVIIVTSDIAEPGAMDAVVALPLDPVALHDVVRQAVQELTVAADSTSEAELNVQLRKLQPTFTPRNYGYRNMRDLVNALAGVALVTRPDGRILALQAPLAAEVVSPLAGGTLPSGDVSAEVTPDHARQLCARLAAPRANQEEVQVAMRQAVEALLADEACAALATTSGLPVRIVSAGFQAAAKDWVKRSQTVTKIFQTAMTGTAWRVVRRSDNDTIVHFVLGDHVPPGFEMVAQAQLLQDPEEERVSQS